jgi:hypothetical protein
VAVIEAFGKVPIGEPHREIGNRDIGNPVDKVFMHFGIAMSETPIGDKDCGHMRGGSCGPKV